MQFTSLIQFGISLIYRFWLRLCALIREHILLRLLHWFTHAWKPASPPSPENPQPRPTPRFILPPWVNELYGRTVLKVDDRRDDEEEAEYQWWDVLVRQSLLKRYHLVNDKLPAASFQPLYHVLTSPTAEERRGSILMNASHQTQALTKFRMGSSPTTGTIYRVFEFPT
jgi:hypothetical protein